MKKKYFIIITAVISLIVIFIVFMNKDKDTPLHPDVTPDPFTKNGELTFISADNKFLAKIDVEIADNDSKRTLGLMFRPFMKESQGMLFIFDSVQPLSFWMKNTMISLDMIFVDKDFKIITIHKNTTPYLEKSYPADSPGLYVVEVVAGFCNKYNIKVGDKISFRRI